MRKDWKVKILDDLCEFVRGPFGGSLKKSCFVDEGYAVYEQQHAIYDQFTDIRYFVDDDKFEEMKRFELQPGDLIMSCSGTIGKVAVVPEDIKKGIINQALLKLTPNDKIDVDYLRYWFLSDDFLNSITKHSKGVAIKNVASVKILKTIEFPLPPLPEQKRIVEILDEAFEAIAQARANVERNIQNAEELFQSKLNEIFDGLFSTYEISSIGKIFDTSAGGTPKKSNKNYYENGSIPWLRSGEVKQGDILETEMLITEKGLAESSAKLFPENTVLIAMYGATAGDVGILRLKASTNQAVCGILPHDQYTAEFIYYLIRYKREMLVKQAIGNAQPNLSQTKIKKLDFPIVPVSKQKEVVQEIGKISDWSEELSNSYSKRLKSLEELKKSILQKAFSGELTTNEHVAA